MDATTARRATLEDLHRVEGNAELIGGRIVPLSPTGYLPAVLAGRIVRSLDDHCRATGRGVAFTDGVGFAVSELPSGRESFSPDVAYSEGPLPADPMDFLPGAPAFAVEVRSKSDYGPAAERELAARRADYFAAGTLVVWDVDPLARVVRIHRADRPDQPETRGSGESADAEPAVPGWRLDLDRILA